MKLCVLYGNDRPPMSHPTRGAWIEMSYYPTYTFLHRSHPTRGAWIEIPAALRSPVILRRRTLPGVRGLKLCSSGTRTYPIPCRTLPGVRGLKYLRRRKSGDRASRTLPGVRGLKFISRPRTETICICRTLPGVRGLKFLSQAQ